MGFQTFKCVICGAEVTKPKSYAIDGGRACRIHQEEINDMKQKKQEEIDGIKNRIFLESYMEVANVFHILMSNGIYGTWELQVGFPCQYDKIIMIYKKQLDPENKVDFKEVSFKSQFYQEKFNAVIEDEKYKTMNNTILQVIEY